MTSDDEIIIALYSDGLASPAQRVRDRLPHRSPKGLGVRTSILRSRGLIATKRGLPLMPVTIAPPKPTEPGTEHPIRCPGCLKVFFPSDSLPIRPE